MSASFTPPPAVVLKCEDAVRYAIFGTGFFLPGCLHRGKVFVQYIIKLMGIAAVLVTATWQEPIDASVSCLQVMDGWSNCVFMLV